MKKEKDKISVQLGPSDPVNGNTGAHVISAFAAFRAKIDQYECLRQSTGQRLHLMISENPTQCITKKTPATTYLKSRIKDIPQCQ